MVIDKTNNLAAFLDDLADGIRLAETGSTPGSDNDIDIAAQDFRSRIEALSTWDANAAPENILSGKTAYVKGSMVNGTMTNNGKVTATLTKNDSYTIPPGYHNGSGTVSITPWDGNGVTTIDRDSNGLKGTWNFNDEIYVDDYSHTFFSVTFYVGGNEYVGLSYGHQPEYENYGLCYHDSDGEIIEVYQNSTQHWLH